MYKHWKYSMAPWLVAVTACGGDAAPDASHDEPQTVSVPQDVFWAELTALCGSAFQGRVVESEPPDAAMSEATLVMHVRECSDSVIRVPFHVGADRSRTWVFTRTTSGLRLKHDHRHEDGSEDEVTQYGGESPDAGSAQIQEFAADEHTATLIPAAAANVWTVEIHPGATFVYALRREGTDRRFRAEFEIGAGVDAPPPPWGGE